MAKNKDTKLALDVLKKVNNMTTNLSAVSKSMDSNLTALDNLVANTTKKNSLIAGLNGLDLSITEMSSLRTKLRTIQQYIDTEKPELTEI